MSRVKQELTETEIAERAAEIRSRWSEREHRKRAGIVETRWIPPVITPIDIGEQIAGWYTSDSID